MIRDSRITILTGHFGSGKTEIALNLALENAGEYKKTAIADLDVVNPYFRTRDLAIDLRLKGIELIGPPERLSSSDLPIVSGEIYRVMHDPSYRLIVDAGGEKDGATALGQYYNEWKQMDVQMLFVLNAGRPYVSTVEGVIDAVRGIEAAGRMKISGIINNTNLGAATMMEDVEKGLQLSRDAGAVLGIPLLGTCISSHLREKSIAFAANHKVFFIQRYMKLPWEI